MTSHKIGVNLRVSVSCDQGGRRYMEDTHSSQFIKCGGKEYEFAYFGIFDGHGGAEASKFARENLLDEITKYDCFWNDNDEDVLHAIKYGFIDTHYAMWKELERWPKTMKGLPNTSGTTASIAIIKNCKVYVGHVGDSGIVLGCNENYGEGNTNAKCLTKDHKPETPEEKLRIEESGGAVMCKSGVQRVVWRRPTLNHKGPIRRSTHIDEIPFLAVARSLGDLWSYDYYNEKFVVSPEPDVSVHKLDATKHKCLIFASDGLWNMVSPDESVSLVMNLEKHFEQRIIHDMSVSLSYWINPAERLVTRALNKWQSRLMKADNTSAIVVFIDPLGPSKLILLKKKREEACQKNHSAGPVLPSINNTNFPVNFGSSLKTNKEVDKTVAAPLCKTPANGDQLKVSTPLSAPAKLTGTQIVVPNNPASEKDKKVTASLLGDSVNAGSVLSQGQFTSLSSHTCNSSGTDLHSVDFSKFDALKIDLKSVSNERLTKDGKSTSKKTSQSKLCSGILQTSRDNVHMNTRKNNSRKSSSGNFGHILKSPKPLKSLEDVLNLNCAVEKNTNNSNLYKTKGHHLRSDASSGFAKKTRRTLCRAKDAARRAMCLENNVFIRRKQNRLTRLKRKPADDVINGPVAKRLRKCDG